MRGTKGVVKAARFAFVDIPSSVLGLRQLQHGFKFMRTSRDRLINPSCPMCDRGVLMCSAEQAPPTSEVESPLYLWSCSNGGGPRASSESCEFRLLASPELAAVKDLARSLRNERVKTQLGRMTAEDRVTAMRGHRNASRVFYSAAALTFAVGLYLLAGDGLLIVSLNWLSFALACFVFGLKRSFRAWQAQTGRVFAEGSFAYWVRNEPWLI